MPPTQTQDEYRDAWIEEVGSEPHAHWPSHTFAAGWTEHDLRVAVTAVRYAATRNSGLIQHLGLSPIKDVDQSFPTAFSAFLGQIEWLSSRGHVDEPVALWWLVVAAGGDIAFVERARREVFHPADGGGSRLRCWRDEGIPMPLAALAWALNLSPQEAGARRRDGELTEQTLLMLARLQGLSLPAVRFARVP